MRGTLTALSLLFFASVNTSDCYAEMTMKVLSIACPEVTTSTFDDVSFRNIHVNAKIQSETRIKNFSGETVNIMNKIVDIPTSTVEYDYMIDGEVNKNIFVWCPGFLSVQPFEEFTEGNITISRHQPQKIRELKTSLMFYLPFSKGIYEPMEKNYVFRFPHVNCKSTFDPVGKISTQYEGMDHKRILKLQVQMSLDRKHL